MDETLTIEESRELLELCRDGKLYEVEEWIRQGKSIRVHPKSRDEPTRLVLRKGFHSLLELLIRHTTSQEELDGVLVQAVRKQRFDAVRMLVEHGANPLKVAFVDVACAWDPGMMRYFLEKGTDVLADDAMAYALTSRVQTALGFYMDCKAAHPEWADALQRQLDMALAIHCREGNEGWVAKLIWAGGNPYAKGRDMECKKNADKPWTQICGAEEAAHKGHLKVLELLDLDIDNPISQEILESACAGMHEDTVRYLLKLGINPNDKEDGGSRGLEAVLLRIDWGKQMQRFSPSFSDTASKCLSMARKLIRHKARWTPDAYVLRATRRAACEASPEQMTELVGQLGRPGVCDPEILRRFVDNPKIQELLKKGTVWHR
jgi:hypothetical protein